MCRCSKEHKKWKVIVSEEEVKVILKCSKCGKEEVNVIKGK